MFWFLCIKENIWCYLLGKINDLMFSIPNNVLNVVFTHAPTHNAEYKWINVYSKWTHKWWPFLRFFLQFPSFLHSFTFFITLYFSFVFSLFPSFHFFHSFIPLPSFLHFLPSLIFFSLAFFILPSFLPRFIPPSSTLRFLLPFF